MTRRDWPAPPGSLTPPRIPGACPTTPHTQKPTTGQFTCYQKRPSSLAIDTRSRLFGFSVRRPSRTAHSTPLDAGLRD